MSGYKRNAGDTHQTGDTLLWKELEAQDKMREICGLVPVGERVKEAYYKKKADDKEKVGDTSEKGNAGDKEKADNKEMAGDTGEKVKAGGTGATEASFRRKLETMIQEIEQAVSEDPQTQKGGNQRPQLQSQEATKGKQRSQLQIQEATKGKQRPQLQSQEATKGKQRPQLQTGGNQRPQLQNRPTDASETVEERSASEIVGEISSEEEAPSDQLDADHAQIPRNIWKRRRMDSPAGEQSL